MKKTVKLFASVLVVLSLLFLAACGSVSEVGTAKIVIDSGTEQTEYEVSLSDIEKKDSALDILNYLNENEGLALDYVESVYGGYISSIGTLLPDAQNNEYISIYTSEECDFGVAPFDTKVEYMDMTLTASGVGISSMTVNEGTVILFRIESY